MAVDDITTVITINMAQNDTTDRQPSAGVEEICLFVVDKDFAGSAPYKSPSINLNLIDGTNNQTVYYESNTTGDATNLLVRRQYAADNTNYFRFTKTGTSTNDYGFGVIAVG